MIDLTSPKGKKDKAARSMLKTPTVPNVSSSIANRIAQCKSSVVPYVPKFIPKRLSGAKSGSPLERLATMKSDKVDFAAKVVPRPIPLIAEIGLPATK